MSKFIQPRGVRHGVRGQALTEYAALLALFALVALALVTLLGTFNAYGGRIIGLVGLDYP